MTSPRRDGDRVQLSACGDIDLASRDALIAIGIGALREPSVRALVIDLSRVTFLDASGLGSLVTIRNAAREHGSDLVLSAVPARILWLLELTDLLKHFTVTTAPSRYVR